MRIERLIIDLIGIIIAGGIIGFILINYGNSPEKLALLPLYLLFMIILFEVIGCICLIHLVNNTIFKK